MHRLEPLFVIATVIAVGLACAATAHQSGEVTYQKEGFSVRSLQSEGLAVLPVVAGEGVEGYRRPFGEAINDEIARYAADNSFSPWQRTMDAINSENLTTAYNDAIVSYRETAIIDRTLVQELGAATGQRYLLFVQLDPPTTETSVQRGVFASGYHELERIGVSAFAQVWDTETGDIVWEGIGKAGISEATEMSTIKAEERDPRIYSRRVAEELIKRLYVAE